MTIVKVTKDDGSNENYETSTMQINKFTDENGQVSFSLNIIDKQISVPLTNDIALVEVYPGLRFLVQGYLPV